jgi:hypothetical protein
MTTIEPLEEYIRVSCSPGLTSVYLHVDRTITVAPIHVNAALDGVKWLELLE